MSSGHKVSVYVNGAVRDLASAFTCTRPTHATGSVIEAAGTPGKVQSKEGGSEYGVEQAPKRGRDGK
ncbi:MAG: hypothetical protein GY753_08080 [Gammaproteobacteria bacterium]|nr:hypothetical protein [Gammaproteobacteria bacterium]